MRAQHHYIIGVTRARLSQDVIQCNILGRVDLDVGCGAGLCQGFTVGKGGTYVRNGYRGAQHGQSAQCTNNEIYTKGGITLVEQDHRISTSSFRIFCLESKAATTSLNQRNISGCESGEI